MQKYHLPSLNWLLTFEAAARHQGMKKAALELNTDHSVVSRQIKLLEEWLGCKLFERKPRGIVLTDAGERLLGAVRTGFSCIQPAVTQLRRNQNPDKLVISVDPDFAQLWLVPRLAGFYAIPDMMIEIISGTAIPAPDDARIHCAIHYADAAWGLGGGEPLFRSTLFPVCTERTMMAQPLRSPDDLRHHVLLHDRSYDEWEDYIRRYAMASDIDVRKGILFTETAQCLDAAARSQGVAMGDDFLAAIYLSEGRLIRPFDATLLSKNAYYLLISEGASNHPLVAAFRLWLLRSIDERRDSYPPEDFGRGH